MRKVLLASAMALAFSTLGGAADAAVRVLYRVDQSMGADQMAKALSNPAYTVTTASGGLDGLDLSKFDLVVYANQANYAGFNDYSLLNSYISGGGKLIYTNWLAEGPDLGGSGWYSDNPTTVNIGSQFGGGSASLTNPGWGSYAQVLKAGSASVAGTYGDGSAAILVGNGGRTIWNGFLNDSIGGSGLYSRQLAYLTGPISAVPEPATWAMMITGFGLAGAAVRRRKALAVAA